MSYRTPTLKNALTLMSLLGMSSLNLDSIPSRSSLGRELAGDTKSQSLMGRSTVFYEDGTVKTFFEGDPLSESSAKPREPSQVELNRIVWYLYDKAASQILDELIGERILLKTMGDASMAFHKDQETDS